MSPGLALGSDGTAASYSRRKRQFCVRVVPTHRWEPPCVDTPASAGETPAQSPLGMPSHRARHLCWAVRARFLRWAASVAVRVRRLCCHSWKRVHDMRIHYTRIHYTRIPYTRIHYTCVHYTRIHYTRVHYTRMHTARPLFRRRGSRRRHVRAGAMPQATGSGGGFGLNATPTTRARRLRRGGCIIGCLARG